MQRGAVREVHAKFECDCSATTAQSPSLAFISLSLTSSLEFVRNPRFIHSVSKTLCFLNYFSITIFGGILFQFLVDPVLKFLSSYLPPISDRSTRLGTSPSTLYLKTEEARFV